MENNHKPKIRFKGFESPWTQRKLGELVSIKSGWSPSEFTSSSDYNSVLFIKVNDLNYSSREQLDSNMRVKENPRFVKMRKSSTIFPKRGAAIMTNKVRIIGVDGYMDTNMMALEPKEIDKNFLYTFIARTGLYKIADTSTLPQINNKHIEPYVIWLPETEEQEKVGEFFYTLDTTIALHQQELDTLKQTKQGFLQKMFPKKGETTPEVRFPGFNDEWKETEFKHLAKIRRGLTYKPIDVEPTGVRVLRSSNVKDDVFALRNDDVFVNPKAINIEYVKENDILITSANGSSKLVGKHALIKNVEDATVHGGFMLIASAQFPYFVNALMSSSWYDKFIHVNVSGGNGAIGNLNKNDLENYNVLAPSLNEQAEIGDFFKQLDELIALQQQELDALKQTKKAFLQKMFV